MKTLRKNQRQHWVSGDSFIRTVPVPNESNTGHAWEVWMVGYVIGAGYNHKGVWTKAETVPFDGIEPYLVGMITPETVRDQTVWFVDRMSRGRTVWRATLWDRNVQTALGVLFADRVSFSQTNANGRARGHA